MCSQSTQYNTLFQKHYLRTVSASCDGRRKTRNSASANNYVILAKNRSMEDS